MIKVFLISIVRQSLNIKIIKLKQTVKLQTVKFTNKGLPAHTSFHIIIRN